MDIGLKNKVVIVTGAKGIGEGIVKVLLTEGAIPVIIGSSEIDNNIAVRDVEAAGSKVSQVLAELSDPHECEEAVKAVIAKYGRIDGLVNNAGVNDGAGPENGGYENFIASFQKNLVHYYLLTQHALPALKISKGAIVNISSRTADTVQGTTSDYAISNGGCNALTREWAVELLKYGIRVNAVVVTECFTSLQNRMTAEGIANAVVFLLSSRSSHTTGQLLYVDGGYARMDVAATSTQANAKYNE